MLNLIEDLGMCFVEKENRNRRFGLYQCPHCLNNFTAKSDSVKSSSTQSCGCIREKHGLRKHRLYNIWLQMIYRTSNPKHEHYKNYGGRGIKVCKRWRDVQNFIADMEPTFVEGLSLDRINNDKKYKPSNCRWATKSVQSRNTRLLRVTNTSGYRGVSWIKNRKKWQTQICVNGDRKHLGLFSTAIKAAIAYDRYVIENNLEHTINGVL